MASRFSAAFFLTASMSPTARPTSRFISRIGIITMKMMISRNEVLANGKKRWLSSERRQRCV